jgi:NHLM bacteriocin system ABC transporter ATP-binding protein
MLSEPDAVWKVRSGRVAIFLVRLVDGKPAGSRHHLFTCRVHDILLPGQGRIRGKPYALLAVGLAESEVEKLPIGTLQDGRELRNAVDEWAAYLCQMLTEDLPPVHAEKPAEDGSFALTTGQRLRAPAPAVHWLRLQTGQMTVLGEAACRLEAPETALPTTGDVWFRAESDVQGSLLSTQAGDSLAMRLDGVNRLTDMVIQQWDQRQHQLEQEELERIAKRHEIAASENRAVIANLRLDKDSRYGVSGQESPLRVALAAIGQEMGIEFRLPADSEAPRRPADAVTAIARASRVRMRTVRLTDDWWKHDVGHLLAFRPDGSPVALILARRLFGLQQYYTIFDPADGSLRRVDEAVTDSLAADAFQFFRPMPLKAKLSMIEVSRFTFKPFLPDIGLLFTLSLIPALLGLVLPIANRLVVDHVIPDANKELMIEIAFGLTAVSIMTYIFSLSQNLLSLRVKTGLTNYLQAAILDRVLRLPNKFIRSYSSGDMLNRSMMISEISTGFSATAISALMSGAMSLLQLGLCYYYSPRLVWIAAVTALFTTVTSFSFSLVIRRKSLALELLSGKLFGYVVQMINGVSKLQIAGAEQRAFNQWAHKYAEQLRMRNDIKRLQQLSGILNTAVQTTSLAVLYYFTALLLRADAQMRAEDPLLPSLLTIGTFFAFQAAFNGVVSGVVNFFNTFITLIQHWAKRELVKPILEEAPEVADEHPDPGRLAGEVELREVVFRYRDDGPLVLNNISLHIHPGDFIALAGPSGSGKSTIIKLLLGFEAPESGAVLYDGRELRTIDVTAVRRQIGVVLQQGSITAGSIYSAICGANQISLEEAWDAARDAGFAEDVESMPMGMHTMVSEGGTTLSGGQRQRLLIARALAMNPKILLFDEATSFLDNRTQSIVSASLQRRKVSRIVVAHRLSTIRDADRIYVLDKGHFIQSGTFQELIKEGGMFKRMVARQLA